MSRTVTKLICIVCPKGCHLTVDGEGNVAGHTCPRGEIYGREEMEHPVRVITSTVRARGGLHRRCPVKSAGAVPKDCIFDVMRALDATELDAPVRRGQLVLRDVCGTGVDIVATRDL